MTKAKETKEFEELEGEKGIIKISKPYEFEGKIYTEIDLREIENLTVADLEAIDNIVKVDMGKEVLKETTMEYAIAAAHYVTKLPFEFFKGIPGKIGIKIKIAVIGFLYN